ncbi:TPA: hypothetical protein ACKRZZ_005465, partial [Pseudomonas aeruginosa]
AGLTGEGVADFLSCLHGSERVLTSRLALGGFLSCLHGSELAGPAESGHAPFLSCLHGSELAPKTYNHLKEKRNTEFFPPETLFFRGLVTC